MKTLKYLTICLVVCCLFSGSIFAQLPNLDHGLGVAKLAQCPAVVGQPHEFRVVVENTDVLDTALDTIHFISFFDVVTTAAGDVQSPLYNVTDFPESQWELNDGASYDGVNGYIILPTGSSCRLLEPFPSHYTPTLQDYQQLENQTLRDLVTINYEDQCNGIPSANCPDGVSQLEARSQCVIELPPDPCVQVVKVPVCDGQDLPDGEGPGSIGEVPVGGNITYRYTISNCGVEGEGGTPLLIESVVDDTFDISSFIDPDCDILLLGESCTFTATTPESLGTAGTITNTVTVSYQALDDQLVPLGIFTGDIDTAVVNVEEASLTCDVQCESVDTGLFTVTLTNTGTKDLNVNAAPVFSGVIPAGVVTGNPVVLTGQQGAPTSGAGPCGSGGGTELIINWTADVVEDICNTFNQLSGSCSDQCPGIPCTVDFDVEKICDNDRNGVPDSGCDVVPGQPAAYRVTVTNNGTCELFFLLTDQAAEITDLRVPASGCVVPEGGSAFVYVEVVADECVPGDFGQIDMPANTATVVAYCCDDVDAITPVGEATSDEAICCYECEGELESCTPGYWKNSPRCWCGEFAPAGEFPYDNTDFMLISSVFTGLQAEPYASQKDKKSEFIKDSMMDALEYGGGRGIDGAVRNLLRHATAAVLNACHSEVQSYPLSVDQIKTAVNTALANGFDEVPIPDTDPVEYEPNVSSLKQALAWFNEEYPCPISSDNASEPCTRNID